MSSGNLQSGDSEGICKSLVGSTAASHDFVVVEETKSSLLSTTSLVLIGAFLL